MPRKSKYKMGWLLVLFDMPVGTPKERREASRFRNDLLDSGYLMLQFSAYARCAVTLEKKQGLVAELKRLAPKSGTIQCLYMTDSQWGDMITFHQRETRSPKNIVQQEIIGEQLQFW